MAKPSIKRIGNFALGPIGVDVFVDTEASGGEAISRDPNDEGKATIVVGIADGWPRTTEVLLHEAFELAATMRGLRFREDDSNPDEGSDKTLFIMTHSQMEKVIADMSYLVLGAMPRLAVEESRAAKRRKCK